MKKNFSRVLESCGSTITPISLILFSFPITRHFSVAVKAFFDIDASYYQVGQRGPIFALWNILSSLRCYTSYSGGFSTMTFTLLWLPKDLFTAWQFKSVTKASVKVLTPDSFKVCIVSRYRIPYTHSVGAIRQRRLQILEEFHFASN